MTIKYANHPVQLIAGPSHFRATPTVATRSGTGDAGRRASRVPSLLFSSIHPLRQPAIPDGGRSEKINMKPLLVIISVTLMGISSARAQEIQVSTPVLIGKVPLKVRNYDDIAKSWGEKDGFGYAFMVYLKNISQKPIAVATDGLSQQRSSEDPKQNVKLDMNKMTLVDGGALVVPSREDLRLVEIRPGEAAAMKIEFKMAVPLEEITVTYSPKDFYDGRFGYWTGKVSSEPLKIDNKE